MRINRRVSPTNLVLLWITLLAGTGWAVRPLWAQGPTVSVSFPASLHSQPITGRILVVLSRDSGREPRLQIGWPGTGAPVFGVDVSELEPGATTVIDNRTPGSPLASLNDLPEGDYWVQALANVYTAFHRADGHLIWAHMDQWEGQRAETSPGNLYSEPKQVHVDPRSAFALRLELTRVIPRVPLPADTPWVKRVKFQSKLLSRFWGRPMYIGATILLPKGYDEHPGVRYPVVYLQNHFDLRAPFGFSTSSAGGEGSRAV